MRLPYLYIAFCAVVLAGFSYAKYQGLSAFGSSGASGGTRSGGFYYVGTSSSYHK